QQQDELLRVAAATLKSTPADVPARVAALVDERKKLERELAEAKKKLAMGGGSGERTAVEEIAGISFVGRVLSGVSPRDLKGLVDEEKSRIGSGIVAVAASSEDGKGAIVVGVTDDLTNRFDAVPLVRVGSEALGGKGGGGRPDMAQAGGPEGAKAAAALDAVKGIIAQA
ncbi:MAG: DHHA1 domain-containing protein, partial [Pseudomonadota bacterium]